MCTRPCKNGGICIPPGLCSCPSGFVGDVCQHGKYSRFILEILKSNLKSKTNSELVNANKLHSW